MRAIRSFVPGTGTYPTNPACERCGGKGEITTFSRPLACVCRSIPPTPQEGADLQKGREAPINPPTPDCSLCHGVGIMYWGIRGDVAYCCCRYGDTGGRRPQPQ